MLDDRTTLRTGVDERRLRMWNPARRREQVHTGRWRFRIARSASDVVRTLPVRVTGRIPRSVATVSIAAPALALEQGQTLDLRGRNRWLDGLAPTNTTRIGDPIITAVRRDDTFVDLARRRIRFSSDDRRVVDVDRRGVLRATGRGVATVTVRVGRAKASTPFRVR